MHLSLIHTFFPFAFLAFFIFRSEPEHTSALVKHAVPAAVTIGPGMQPKAAIDHNDVIKVVYGQGDKLYYIESGDKGKSFTQPGLVASLPEGLMLGMGRGPQITISGKNTVITAVNKKGNIYSWKLNAQSGKWEGTGRINDVDTVAKEGFVALAAGKGNNVYAVWNDLRNGSNQLYGSVSKDGGLTWGANQLIYASPDTTICECCKVSMVYNNRDKLYIMWRNQLNGFRDMYLVSVDNAMHTDSAPVKLGSGTWKLEGCPMDGGNLFSDEKGNIFTAWRREGDVFLCEPGQEERRLGKGKTPVVTKNKGGIVTVWSENNEIIAFSPQSQKIVTLGNGRYPEVVSGKNVSIVLWETVTKEIKATSIAGLY